MKNLHLTRSEQTYAHLRAEAERQRLRHQLRKARHARVAAYAAEMAGTGLDLNPDLEAAGIEHLVKTGKTTK
jgi:hypothetical protein